MSGTLSNRVAVYTGMFDPIHNGHLDMIARGSRLYERLVVGVGINPEKEPFFTPVERVDLVREVVSQFGNVEVEQLEGLAVRFVRDVGAGVMLRGLRTTSDMEYEFTMALMNRNLDDKIETVFLMAKEEYAHLSSSLLRQIASHGGPLERFLPEKIKNALQKRVNERRRL